MKLADPQEPDYVPQMSNYHLAQINIALAAAPLDSPRLADFVARLDEINLLAESSPGFVWRLISEDGDDSALRIFGNPDMLVNLSVWRDLPDLRQYVYRSAHTELLKNRDAWFTPMQTSYQALWWLPVTELPTVEDAAARLKSVQSNGPSNDAFTFAQPFAPPSE